MDERIIDIAEEPVSLSVRLDQLVIKRGETEDTVPLEELAALVVSHPVVRYSHPALVGVCENGGAIVICNSRRLPVGMLLPLTGHSIQAERFTAQSQATAPTKKRIWATIIKHKIRAQGNLLKDIYGEDFGFDAMARKVRSGDPENLEARAARQYWGPLFGDMFRRIPGSEEPINRLLNYGYAVLRGLTARAICSAGLHPCLGVHHHNRYNPFCLADDLMEPFRPTVDRLAHGLVSFRGADVPLDKDSKRELISGLFNARYDFKDESRSLFDTLTKVSSSLAQVFTKTRRAILLPRAQIHGQA